MRDVLHWSWDVVPLWHCLCLFCISCQAWTPSSSSPSSRGTTANLYRLAKTPSTSLRSACWQWSRPSPTTLSWSLSWNSSWQLQDVLSSCLVAGTICSTSTRLSCCWAPQKFLFLNKWSVRHWLFTWSLNMWLSFCVASKKNILFIRDKITRVDFTGWVLNLLLLYHQILLINQKKSF